MRFKKWICMLTSGALVAAALTGCTSVSKNESETVKLGVISPLTGDVAVYGQSVKNAVQLAVEDYNAKGGVLGKKIETVVYDSKADATEAGNAFNKLVNNDKVDAVIGEVISSATLAIVPLAAQYNIPMITPTATNADVTKDAKTVFRACYIDPFQGKAVGQFAFDNLKAKTAAIMYNTADDYSVGLAEAFKAAFEAKGGKVLKYEGYAKGTTDYSSILTNIKESNPNVLFIPDYYNSVALIAKQIKQAGITATLLGGDGWDGVNAVGGAAIEGGYFSNHYAADDTAPEIQKFVKEYKEQFKKEPDALAALGYDAAVIMLEAIKAAGSTEKDKVIDALVKTDVQSVTGHITFDQDHNPVKSISMIQIKEGKNILSEKVNPK